MAESAEADEDEDNAAANQAWEAVDTSWVSLDTIQRVLQSRREQEEKVGSGKLSAQKLKFSRHIKKAMDISLKLWSDTDTFSGSTCKSGSIDPPEETDPQRAPGAGVRRTQRETVLR